MPKATTPTAGRQNRRHNPLEEDILATGILKSKPSKSKRRQEGENANFIESKASKQILRLGRELVEEERIESGATAAAISRSAFDPSSARGLDFGDSDEDEVTEGIYEDEAFGDQNDEVASELGEEIEVNDLETFNRFLPSEGENPLAGWLADGEAKETIQAAGTNNANLADLILAKISQHEAANQHDGDSKMAGPFEEEYQLPPKVVDVFSKIGLILSRYKSGPLPKVFKILPTIPHWEDILLVTKPEEWTPHACYAATRLFVSAKPIVAQRFMEMVILERVRDDIHENRKLNVHLFNSLKKCLYKPAAFFKGFLFPLIGSGTCTLREAHIISAVLTRISIPVLHSAAAIKGLCDIAAQEASQGTEGGGATNVFLKTLIEKGYALPWQVIDSLVFHFLRFRNVDFATIRDVPGSSAAKSLPVIWHQSLLAFAQKYRNDITEDQREALLDLLLTHGHSAIGPEVRRELLAGRGRGVPLEPQGPAFDGDDTMLVDS
ncbi:hypothetical protein VTK73DRAFT_6942 [Phialemonium thermophilum]|uniref:Bystin n=1 Tax=Phialemonium thermophilum TaxID=223376 RepID=A0ABR3XUP5_9PEZI